jgi:hypothetical protein
VSDGEGSGVADAGAELGVTLGIGVTVRAPPLGADGPGSLCEPVGPGEGVGLPDGDVESVGTGVEESLGVAPAVSVGDGDTAAAASVEVGAISA